MAATSAPIRFLATVGLLWIGGRMLVLLPGAMEETLSEVATALIEPASAEGRPAEPAPAPAGGTMVRPPLAILAPVAKADAARPVASAAMVRGGGPIAPAVPMLTPVPQAQDLPAPFAAMPAARVAASRWAGQAYLYARGGGRDGLASGGQLGGGQIGLRVARSLTDGPVRLAAAARLSAPLEDKGAEAALGVDWLPLPGSSARISIERRIALDRAGRDAWSAYAAGGFWRALGDRVAVDGYAQAGFVGARRRDGFVDGAIRVVRHAPIGPDVALHWGAGLWGGAQPGVARIDAGPRVAIVAPVAGRTLSAAVEARLRVAGDAAPGSGVALTLATNF